MHWLLECQASLAHQGHARNDGSHAMHKLDNIKDAMKVSLTTLLISGNITRNHLSLGT